MPDQQFNTQFFIIRLCSISPEATASGSMLTLFRHMCFYRSANQRVAFNWRWDAAETCLVLTLDGLQVTPLLFGDGHLPVAAVKVLAEARLNRSSVYQYNQRQHYGRPIYTVYTI